MVIVLAREGQLCNQIYTIVGAYSLAIEKKQRLYMPVVSKDVLNNFPNLSNKNGQFFFYHSMFAELIRKFAKLMLAIRPKLEYRVYDENKRVNIFWDWKGFIDYGEIRWKSTECRKLLDFGEKVKKDNIRTDYDHCIVAVRVRRRDYIEFCEGKYYFSDEQYLEWMKQLSTKRDDVLFYIFSDEILDEKNYFNRGIEYEIYHGDKYSDLYMMSQCDYIIGPPSSFSTWAARYGKKGLQVLTVNHVCSWGGFVYF